ncbi:UHRF1-binding protein 1 [Liparis tanakae]|uniref:UHRF1-binding protein 1 n=1 Tax=Liparis tanakae TaxID=230148 RepID=A0A4Z2I5X0_9TELE|nr:UHRF1-binding protein 1 [Liparis tanakae]
MQVSSRGCQNKKTRSLLSCNRKALRLPDDVPAVHLQFTEYYFPDNPSFSVPTSNLYAQLNSLQLCVDPASVLWINLFSRGLLHTLDQVKAFYHLQDSSRAEEHSLSVTVPQMVLSNTRLCPHGSRADLGSACGKFARRPFFQHTPPRPFPRDQSAFLPIPSAFLQHSRVTEPPPLERKQLRSQDVWSLSLSRVTLGFDGARRFPKGGTQPFVEPFAMSVWMCQPSALRNGSSSSSSSPDGAPQSSSEGEEASLASIHFLAHTITPVKMWLNHYQYVALLRMKDAMARLGAELGRDLRDVEQARGQKTKSATVCLALLVDSAELGLLLPPVSTDSEEEVLHTPETDSASITDSDVSPTHHSPVLEDSGVENGLSSINTAPADEQEEQEEQDGGVEEACEAVEEGSEDAPVLSPPLSPGQSAVLSRELSNFSLEGELSSALNVTKDATKDAISASLDLTKGAFSITKDAFSMLSRGSGMSKLFSTQAKEQVQRSEETSSPSLAASLRHQSMKQSSSQHSFDSAILDGSLPDENLSVDSDTSDNFVVLMGSESGMETRPNNRGNTAPGTEGGSSADLSSSLSQSIEDMSEDMSSVLLLVLSGAACTVEVKGEDQVVAVEAQNMSPVQMGNLRVSDLLAGLIQAPSGPVPKPDKQGTGGSPAVCMRAEMGPCAARHSAVAEASGFLDIRLQDCRAQLLASTVTNIGPFLEDEFSVDGQPMKLHMSNITITMKDDGPKIYPTAPQAVPASFVVDQLLLERGDDGIMRLRAGGADPPKASAGVPVSCSEQQLERQTLESQLSDAQAELTQARGDRQRLLLEVRKHDPTFTL